MVFLKFSHCAKLKKKFLLFVMGTFILKKGLLRDSSVPRLSFFRPIMALS